MLLLLAVSCDTDETGGINTLPDGKYPLQLTTEVVQPQTRGGGKDVWTGTEEIGVKLDGMSTAKKYVVASTGEASPADAANTIYWQDTDEKQVTAWYPYTTASSVDISDQSNGYAAFDFMSATATGSYQQTVSLSFKHLMSKVVVKLTAGDGITADEIAGASVTLRGKTAVSFTNGAVTTSSTTDGLIESYYDATAKKYEAVVVPQDMTGKMLVVVNIGNDSFAYTPETTTEGNLEAGTSYEYAVTVKANGIEVTEVKVGSEWSESASEDATVSSTKIISYTAGEVKAGDYIYSDGTTSDGGLRKRYYGSNTAPVIADPKPEPDANKTVVGIVFWVPKDTETHKTGRSTPASLTYDKIMAADYPNCTHGLAVAIKDVESEERWQVTTNDYVATFQKGSNFIDANKSDYVTIEYSNANSNRILGYQNTQVIKAYNDYIKFNALSGSKIVKPVEALSEFTTSTPAPTKSTGWFIPSPKELHMLCYKDVDNIYNQRGSGWTETKNIVNASLEKTTDGETLTGDCWTSTENSNMAFTVGFTYATMGSENKDVTYKVRAICAF